MLIALFVYFVAISCWLGGIVFFSFFTTRIAFTSLPLADAGRMVRALFPQYYMLGYIAGTVAVALAIYFTAVRGPRLWWGCTTLLLAIGLGLTFYAGTVVLPSVEAIRTVKEEPNPDPAKVAQFDRLHRLSVMLNGTVLILNLAALIGTAGALTPRG